ncbi:MAG: indolepyruvate oxidoreductase subunit beta [Bacteroidota bacterium]
MKTDIILAGVGGQGILSIAGSISMAALNNNLDIKQSEVHGMSQRGGAVQSNLRISDKKIASDLIPKGKVDLILSVEPMEALRYIPFLSKDGWIVTSSNPFKNIEDYPDEEDIYAKLRSYKKIVMIDSEKIAAKIGSKLASNIVMLGAASPFIEMSFESLEEGVRQIFASKGEMIIRKNIDALQAGREASLEAINELI